MFKEKRVDKLLNVRRKLDPNIGKHTYNELDINEKTILEDFGMSSDNDMITEIIDTILFKKDRDLLEGIRRKIIFNAQKNISLDVDEKNTLTFFNLENNPSEQLLADIKKLIVYSKP